MKRALCAWMLLGCLLALGFWGCPPPTVQNELPSEAVSESQGEARFDASAPKDMSEPAAPDAPASDTQATPENAAEPPTERLPEPDERNPKDCPRGKLYDDAQAACIDFPKRELASEEVTFTNSTDTVTLSGTLLKPKVAAGIRLPAIIFVHGSGPNDRDETSSGALGLQLPKPVKVFKDIAEYFAARGYVVLRYDKRTFGLKDPKKAVNWTVDSFTQDAGAALDFLKQRADVQPQDLTVMGHSQGGTLVLDLAKQRRDIKSVVMLAGPAGPLKDLFVGQFQQIIKWLEATPPSAKRDQQIAQYKAQIDLFNKTIPAIEDGTYKAQSFQGASTAFWKSWIENHKRIEANLKALAMPLAIISGTLDYNVPPAQTELLKTWRGQQKQDFIKVYEFITHPLVYVFANKAGDAVHEPLLKDLLGWMNGQ